MAVCFRDRHVVAGHRTGLLRIPSAALVARATPHISHLCQRSAGRDGRLEGVECSAVMSAIMSTYCLTRVMTDDDRGIEIAQLQSVMQRIQSALRDVPPAQREYIANALLNLAVSLQTDASTRAARG
jgi:hypothetical protein